MWRDIRVGGMLLRQCVWIFVNKKNSTVYIYLLAFQMITAYGFQLASSITQDILLVAGSDAIPTAFFLIDVN